MPDAAQEDRRTGTPASFLSFLDDEVAFCLVSAGKLSYRCACGMCGMYVLITLYLPVPLAKLKGGL